MYPKSSTGCSSCTYDRASTVNNALLKMRQNIGKLVTLRTLPQHPTNATGKSAQGTIVNVIQSKSLQKPVYEINWTGANKTSEALKSDVIVHRSRIKLALEPTAVQSEDNSGVYVLQMKQTDYFYVGKSKKIGKRIAEHRKGRGSAFCHTYGGGLKQIQRLTPSTCNPAVDEQQELLAQMIDKGFNNVRGWEFASPRPLTALECEIVKKLIFGSADLCRKCGRVDHFASDCTNDTKEEWLRALETIQRGAKSKDYSKIAHVTSWHVLRSMVRGA